MIHLFPLIKVLQEILMRYSIPEDLFGKVCIIIDKVCSIWLSYVVVTCKHDVVTSLIACASMMTSVSD